MVRNRKVKAARHFGEELADLRDMYLHVLFGVYDELFGGPEWADVEELWFNTYNELLEREEEEHG